MVAETPARPKPSFDEARALIAENAPAPTAVEIALDRALERVTIDPVYAMVDYPLFDASAMDGFTFDSRLVACAAEFAPVRLSIGTPIPAGALLPDPVAGAAHPISTGAPIPPGCDVVIPKEAAFVSGAVLSLVAPASPGRHIRLRGEDAMAGDRILEAGCVITPEIIGALSCYGHARIRVTELPAVTIISTGAELLGRPGEHAAHMIFNSNGPMIEAMVSALRLPARRMPPVRDEMADLMILLEQIVGDGVSKVVVSTGGVSAGDHDLLPAALRAIGAVVHFHGVRTRPGKPVLFATLPGGALFFGLPGNPVAAAVGFRFFVSAAIRSMLGLCPEAGTVTPLDVSAREGTTLILKGRSYADATGATCVEIREDQRSHTMRPLIEADCWVVADRMVSGQARHRRFPMSGALIAR